MLEIVLLGLNHKTAPVELREKLAFSSQEAIDAIEALQKKSILKEVLLFSTCNRVEILLVTQNSSDAATAVKTFLSEFKNIPTSQFESSLYIHEGDQAIRHIFRVASSLDSMIVGEPQILGQYKDAYRTATKQKSSGVILNRLLHKAFFVAKKVRNETGIADSAVSISYAAIELGRKIFGDLEGKQALLIGAGEMAELAVEHLIRNRVSDIYVANRTFERGVDLAGKFNGKALRFEEITDSLEYIDIIISSTGSPDFVITRDQVKKSMRTRRNQPIFLIDIAVPRDIDPDINRINNAYVYDIDDLKDVVDDNVENRQKEAVKGERIVDEAVIKFLGWYESLDAIPTVVDMRNKASNIAKAEVEKTLQSLPHLSKEDSQAVYKMADALINKILHDPTVYLKSDGCQKDKSLYIDITRKLFNLDD